MEKSRTEEAPDVLTKPTNPFEECTNEELFVLIDQLQKVVDEEDATIHMQAAELIQRRDDKKLKQANEERAKLFLIRGVQHLLAKTINKRKARKNKTEKDGQLKELLKKSHTLGADTRFVLNVIESAVESYHRFHKDNQMSTKAKIIASASVSGASCAFSYVFFKESPEMQGKAVAVATAAIATALFGNNLKELAETICSPLFEKGRAEKKQELSLEKLQIFLAACEKETTRNVPKSYFTPRTPLCLSQAGWSQSYYLP